MLDALRQGTANHLAPETGGYLIGEGDLARTLVAGQAARHEVDDVVLLDGNPVACHDVGPDRLAGVRVRHAHDRRSADGRVLQQDLLHLGGEHVETRHDDEVLDAVDHVQEALVVDHRDVPGVQPALVVEHAGGGLRVVPVAGEDVGTAHEHLTGVTHEHVLSLDIDQAHLHTRDRHSHRTQRRLDLHRGGHHR